MINIENIEGIGNFINPLVHEKDMTYILGARCSDGVVLVGDTKVTLESGTDYTYAKKISSQLRNIVMGSAGVSGLYRDFQNRVVVEVTQTQQDEGDDSIKLTTIEGFSLLITKVLEDMRRYYSYDLPFLLQNLDIICAMRIGMVKQNMIKTELTRFVPYGMPLPINQIGAVGHGKYYGNIFTKHIWNPNMTMTQTAKLGVFIIKFIDKMDLDYSVGYNEEFLPGVYNIPDIIIPPDFKPANEKEFKKEFEKLEKRYPIYELQMQQ